MKETTTQPQKFPLKKSEAESRKKNLIRVKYNNNFLQFDPFASDVGRNKYYFSRIG